MKIRFNIYERAAGIFMMTAIVGSVVATVGVAVKKGWFDEKVKFATDLASADGIHEGTYVQMAGLRAGEVTDVELKATNEIHVRFEVSAKFKDRIHEDSVVRVIRPFIIGEKVLEIEVGADDSKIAESDSVLKSEATTDLMDLVSGRTLGPYLETMGKMMENLRFIAEALLDKQHSKSIVKMFDDLQPMMHNLRSISGDAAGLLHDVNSQKQLSRVVNNLVRLTDEVNKQLPAIAQNSPKMLGDLATIAKNMAALSEEVEKAMPAIQQMGPELPKATRRAMEALDETVVTLKALQKSFLLRGNVRDVREEEAARDQSANPPRTPADQNTQPNTDKKP